MTTPPAKTMPLRRRVSIVAAIVILTLVPALVMLPVTALGTGSMRVAASWASIPAIVGIFAAVAGGRSRLPSAQVWVKCSRPVEFWEIWR